jgi:HK97 family phage prohead protease
MSLVIVRNRADYLKGKKAVAAKVPKKKSTPPPPDEFELVRRWEATFDLKAPGSKKFREVKIDGAIVDYLDVVIDGYLSTFKNVTPADRDGDAVEPGAFADTIQQFMTNPVLLVDHINMVEYLAGSFTSVKEDRNGLKILAEVSNSPDMRHVRFKLAEGHLKALSMGGIFYYREDKRTIFKVALWEGSLVTIPANQDALFRVRSLNDQEKKFLKSPELYRDYYDFLHAQQLQNRKGLAA